MEKMLHDCRLCDTTDAAWQDMDKLSGDTRETKISVLDMLSLGSFTKIDFEKSLVTDPKDDENVDLVILDIRYDTTLTFTFSSTQYIFEG